MEKETNINIYECSVRHIQLLYVAQRNKIVEFVETNSYFKKLALFAVITSKLVDIVFEHTVDKIKGGNQKLVTP